MFNQQIGFDEVFLIVFITQLAGIIPISIGGIGVIEMSLVYGLSLYGIANETGLAIALINRISVWIVALFGGGIWIYFKNDTNKQKAPI
jgi:uncharacterized protein (TIRG00374 family)